MGYLPAGKDVSTEDEESPSVGTVIRQRLLDIVTENTVVFLTEKCKS
jgi:hypothetical protein